MSSSFSKPAKRPGPPPPLPPLGVNSVMPMFPQGITLVTGPTGSGKSSAMAAIIGDVTHPRWRLPDVDADGILSDDDQCVYDEAVRRVTNLLDDKYLYEPGVNTVTDLLKRDRTPGNLRALLFCEQFLISGGLISNVARVGKIFLPSRWPVSGINDQLVVAVSDICEPFFVIELGRDDATMLLDTVAEYRDSASTIKSIIIDRGITDIRTVREIIVSMGDVKSAVQSGVL